MAVLSDKTRHEIQELPGQFPEYRSAVLPALDLAQEEIGYLSPDAMAEVGALLKLDPGYVEGVATFYSLLYKQPVGKHHFLVCDNLSCTLRGAAGIVDHFREQLGVEPREVTPDGLFSFETVECMGACDEAPMCRVDHEYHTRLDAAAIDRLIGERRGTKQPRGKSRGR